MNSYEVKKILNKTYFHQSIFFLIVGVPLHTSPLLLFLPNSFHHHHHHCHAPEKIKIQTMLFVRDYFVWMEEIYHLFFTPNLSLVHIYLMNAIVMDSADRNVCVAMELQRVWQKYSLRVNLSKKLIQHDFSASFSFGNGAKQWKNPFEGKAQV